MVSCVVVQRGVHQGLPTTDIIAKNYILTAIKKHGLCILRKYIFKLPNSGLSKKKLVHFWPGNAVERLATLVSVPPRR